LNIYDILIYIDRNNFKPEKNFELVLSNTLKKIKEKLNGYPSVLKSGNGYHIIQPIEGITFESYYHNETLLFIKNELSFPIKLPSITTFKLLF
jgi:predicted translin family RNA/ssDNA-binding protein